MSKDAESLARFAIPFAQALTKLRKAKDDHSIVTLTADEAAAIVEAFQLLRSNERNQ